MYFPPLICVQFDDGFKSDYTEAFQYMLSKGVPYGTTAYIIGKYGAAKYLHWRDVIKMKAAGWEFTSHFSYGGCDETEIRRRFQEAINFFNYRHFTLNHHVAHGSPPSSDAERQLAASLAPEYCKTVAQKSYSSGYLHSYENIDFYALKRTVADLQTESQLTTIRDLIDEAVNKNKIIIVRSHEIVEGEPGQYQARQDLFRAMIDYAVTSGIKFVNIEQLYNIVTAFRRWHGITV